MARPESTPHMPPIEIPALKDYSPGALDGFFTEILAQFDQDAAAASTVEAVEQLRIRWIGRKQGLLTRVSEVLKGAPPEARREVGMRFNALKSAIEPRCDPEQLKATAPVTDAIDITLPGTRRALGAEHPLVRTMHEIVSVFAAMGYSVGLGPEVETDYYNFESLNFPPGHPARDTQDTLVVAHCHPWQGAPQRCGRRHPLPHLSPGGGALCGHQHYLLRSQGHARSRHEGVLRI
jgi:phenylalanyl-tRNA synthetase alpha chain